MDKQKLKEYVWIKKNIEQLEFELLSLESRATKVTQTISDEPSATGFIQDKTADIVGAIIDTQNLINKQLLKMYALRDEIEEAIDKLSNQEKCLMRARYIEDKAWEQIAVDMNHCWRQIHYIHSRALKNLAHHCTH